MQSDLIVPLVSLIAFSFGSNLPLGYLRAGAKKFSIRWLVLIHLSIPFIVILRGMLGFSWRWIPITLGCAVAGQLVGSRLAHKGQP